MDGFKSIGRETLFSIASGLIYAAGQWLLLKLFFVFYSTEIAGWYAYAMSIIAPVVGLGGMGLRPILVTDARGQYSFSDYFAFRKICSAMTFIALVVIYLALPNPKVEAEGLTLGFCILALARSIEMVSDIVQGEYQRQGRLIIVFASSVIKLVFGVGLFGLMAYYFSDVRAGLLVLALANILTLFAFEFSPKRLGYSPRGILNARTASSIFWLSLPAGLNLLLVAFQSSIPRMLLANSASLQLLAVFAALTYLGVIGGFVSNAIGTAIAPVLGRQWANSDFRGFERTLLAVLIVDTFIGVGLLGIFLLFGQQLLATMFSREVATYSSYLPWVAAYSLATFWSSHLGCGLTVLRRFKTMLGLNVARIIVGTLICYALIHYAPLKGALAALVAFPMISILPICIVIFVDIKSARERNHSLKDLSVQTSNA